jgi:hypothetical protein
MEHDEFIKLECKRFNKCKTLIQISAVEYDRRKEKFGQDYKPWCGPCTYEEDKKYRTYHSD